MKRSLKATALLLAVAMALTACRSETQTPTAKTLEKEYNVYLNAAVTEVEDMPCTLNGVEGTYSGEWKGNRPEGEGTLVISENEYYSGEWKDGYVSGECEFSALGNDGTTIMYSGECEYNMPSGRGQMTICDNETGNMVLMDGDFNNLDTLILYSIDANGKLIDVSGFVDNEIVSYVDNPNAAPSQTDDFFCDRGTAGQVNYYKSRYSKYIGQVNEKGLPNGYGYYEEEYEYNESHSYKAIGSWKNGKLQGYFTEETVDSGSKTKTKNNFWLQKEEYTETFCNTVRLEGYLSGNRLSGSYTKYEKVETNPSQAYDGVFITSFDESTSTETTAKHLPDGTHSFEILHKTGATTYDQGQYYRFDKNEELTVHKELQNGSWVTLMDIEKVREEAKQRLYEIGGYVLFTGLFLGFAALALHPSESDKQWYADFDANLEARREDFTTNQEIRKQLLNERSSVLSEAKRESGSKRSDLLKKADDLQKEADSHKIVIY